MDGKEVTENCCFQRNDVAATAADGGHVFWLIELG